MKAKNTVMRVEHREVDVADVMRYFIKGFDLPAGTVATQEWLYDSHQGKVVFKFYTDNETDFDPVQGETLLAAALITDAPS